MLDNPIPLIDLSGPATPQELALQISDAVRTVGFLHIKGLNVTPEQARRAFAISKELYDSPMEERAACPHDESDRNGHVAYKASRLAESKGAGDLKENFAFGRFNPPHTETQQRLPPVLQKHREELLKFHADCYEATCKILDAFSVALNLPVNYFRDRHTPGGNAVTLINYPPTSGTEGAGDATVARASAHKDWGSVTLLFQEENGTPGLEIFLPTPGGDGKEGNWFPAPIIPDTVLVNVGLALELWTGGMFQATLHRVVMHNAADGSFQGRKSIAFFVQPEDSVVFDTIQPDGTIVKTPGALTSREFFKQRMDAIMVAAN
ncbi:Clavaminate synthase-like protein [Meredithblackwellia eburnea MCA 4105]